MGCVLQLKTLLFDKINFNRLGEKNENELNLSISTDIDTTNKNIKKVSVTISGKKEKEYTFEVKATGVFKIDDETDESFIQQNAVAIIMPYVRSEISLLTAQPYVETVVLPPFNIVEMLKK